MGVKSIWESKSQGQSQRRTEKTGIPVWIVKTVRTIHATHHVIIIVHEGVVEKTIPVESVDPTGIGVIIEIMIAHRIVIVVIIVLVVIVGVLPVIHPRSFVVPGIVV